MPPSQVPSWQLSAEETHFQTVENSYRELSLAPFNLDVSGTAWGDIDGVTKGYLLFLAEQASVATQLLGPPDPNGWIVDVSGGSGYLLRTLSEGWCGALHLEAHLPSLRTAFNRASQAGISNMVFVRGSYLRPPLKPNSFTAAFSMDTIIRSSYHNRLLLRNVQTILTTNGKAIVDVHARTFLRKVPSSSITRDYSRSEFLRLLECEGLKAIRLRGAGYVPTKRSWPDSAFRAFKLMTRIMRWPSRWIALAIKA